jgi:hypothetical protein
MLDEDEDDNEEDDLSLINPKFSRNSTGHNGAGPKKIKKLPSDSDKGTVESQKIKMKYWKMDFYRDQDRDKMDMLVKKLCKMRNKGKSSSKIRKIVSSQSKVSHKVTQNTSKVTNRKNSKKNPYANPVGAQRLRPQ